MFSLLQLPKIAVTVADALFGDDQRLAMEEGAEKLRQELAKTSPGGIANSWEVRPLSEVMSLSGASAISQAVVSEHPGARPLDQGARWPGAMPPWGPGSELADWAETRGIPPYLVARGLKRNGLKARRFTKQAIENKWPEIREYLRDRGIRVALKRLSRD